MEVTKIVITGGPCAGKSTAMSWVETAFTQLGYKVLFVPETATELISGGVAPWTCRSPVDFQRHLLTLQLEKEKVFERAGMEMGCEKLLIVCDRGCLDNKAYLSDDDFYTIAELAGSNEVELRDHYDAVFHLETTAKGAEEYYTLENNSARREDCAEARRIDDRLMAAWTGHPHFRVITNEKDFERKMKKLVAEIASFLGEPEPLEIERKYLIEYPDTAWLSSLEYCTKVEIVQTYLKSTDDCEVRVRKRGSDGHFIFFKTEKKTVSAEKRVELEYRLTREEYESLLLEADPKKHSIVKDRYCLLYDNQYFEIDVYPFWDDKAIMELEMSREADEPRFPEGIKIIREVTGEREYKNSVLATV